MTKTKRDYCFISDMIRRAAVRRTSSSSRGSYSSWLDVFTSLEIKSPARLSRVSLSTPARHSSTQRQLTAG